MTTPARKPSTPADLAVDFNFDTWEREIDVKPFVVVIEGKPYTAADVALVDYRELNRATLSDDEAEVFKLLFPKDWEKILSAKVIKAGALTEFSDVVMKHYQLGPTGGSAA